MTILSYVFYAYFIAGSVTLGYLLLRITYPELRTLTSEEKLGAAGVTGALMAIAAFIIDYIYEGKLEVLYGNGTYPIIVFLLFVLSFLFLKLYFVFSKPDFLTVGVPVQNPITINIQRTEAKDDKAEREVFEKIIGQRQGSDIANKGPGKKKELIQKLRQTEIKVVAEEQVELKKKGGFLSTILGMFAPKRANRPVALDEMKKTKMVPVRQLPIQQPQVQTIPQTRPFAGNSKSASMQPTPVSQPAPAQSSAPEPRKGFMSMIEGIIGGEKKPSPQQPPIQTIKRPLVQSEQTKTPATPVQPSQQTSPQSRSSQTSSSPQIQPPATGQPSQAQPTPLPKLSIKIPEEKFDGLRSEIMTGEPLKIPEKPKLTEAEKSEFQTNPDERAELKKKSEQLQEELILRDILPKEIVSQPEKPSAPQIQSGQHRMYEAVQQSRSDVIIHRRYMLRNQESTEPPKGVSVIAAQQVAQADNFDSLVNDVYTQLKTSQKEGVRSNLAVSPPKETLSKKEAPKQDLSFDDLLGEKAGDKKEGAAPSGVLTQLQNIAGEAPKKDETQKSDVAFVKIEAEKSMGCPTCHTKNSKIIFCPYCGTGMCANCSPNIKIQEGAFVYTCPKCKEDVDVRKKPTAGQPAAAS